MPTLPTSNIEPVPADPPRSRPVLDDKKRAKIIALVANGSSPFGSNSERSRRVAMERKSRGERRTPVSYTRSSRCTIGATPRHVIVLAHRRTVSMDLSSVPFQWFSRIPQQRSMRLYLL